jgi:integrase
MPRRSQSPSYRHHKPSGQAVVTLDGRDFYLGHWDSPESHAEYDRRLAEWLTNGRKSPLVEKPQGRTISALILAYWRYVEHYYVKNGKPTSEQQVIRQALGPVRQLYGHTLAKDFGPLALEAVRGEMIQHRIVRKVRIKDPATGEVRTEERLLAVGLARRNINKQISRIRRMFAWAVEEELVPVEVHAAILRVQGLRKGKGQAREKPRVRPVELAAVEATLPHLPAMVRAMVEVQRLCGGRPQDIVEMRPIDIDMAGSIWEYRPRRYKTEHRNDDDAPERERIVFLGPKAQAILKPLLPEDVEAHIFSPQRSEKGRNLVRRRLRKTPLWPSHLHRQKKKRATLRARPPCDYYDVATYRRAIRRACEKAGVPVWHPNQLRHLRGTEIRKGYGLEASQAVLGHAELSVTQVYAEVDLENARQIMGEVG